ncbi:MAG: helix-turn-helix transcriptional regulator, partial [Lachnospiraceae bacterium]|nr:helix-turn-helix transcriptional regulator [Lachnospiraceae bacterium]
ELLAEIEKGRVLDVEFVRACCQDLVDGCKVANIEFVGDELEEICKRTKGEIGEASSFSRLKAVTEGFFEELEGTMLVQEKPYHKYVKLALAYVKDNYAAIESLAEVAGYVNLNTEYFCRIFKAEVGTTFNNYLTEYRVKKAIELLEGTDLKVYEVAEKVGYTNLSYFSRVFKKVTGENPFVYKN